jgi:Kef-type K+ transport system membrane component KefB
MTFEIILEVLPVRASAILLGEAFEQFRLPSVAGQLLSGMILSNVGQFYIEKEGEPCMDSSGHLGH